MDTSRTIELRCANGKVVQGLPNVCMACGKPATQSREWTGTLQPLWFQMLMSLLPLSEPLGFTEVTITMPLCEAHSRAKDRAKSIALLGSGWVGWVLVLLISYALLIMMNEILEGLLSDALGDFSSYLFPLFVVAGLIGRMFLVMIAASSLPRILRIDDNSVTIKGVSDKFRRAVLQAEGQQAASPPPH